MYVIVGIHRPKLGKEQGVLEALGRFGKTMHGRKGLITFFVCKDDATGALLGAALWDSKSDYEAALPQMSKDVEGVDFEPLELFSEVYRGLSVSWA
jgi:hypothetical protein